MENIKYAPEEPICAIATALAPSALGIIRCSGKNSISLVSKIFFGWTWWMVLICSLVGALFELLCEVVLSPLSFKMVKNWHKENVGYDYINFINKKENN